MEAKEFIAELVEKSRAAQREFEKFSQEKTDEIVRAIAKTVFDNADPLAKMAAEETRMGVYADKISQVKNGTAITLHKETGGKLNDTQYFTFKKSADNTYLIQPRNSNYTVNVSARKSGSKVICWTSTKKNNEEWIIEFSGSGYTFRLKNQPNLYLTQSGDSLKLQKKTGNDNQLFFIQAE